MMHSPSDEISRILNLMPDCWKDSHKLAWAHDAARRNRTLALDQAPPGSSLDADIHKFFSGGDQAMPMTTSPSGAAAMPSGFNDNYTSATGGGQFHRRNHGSDADPAPISRLPPGMVARELAGRGGSDQGPGSVEELLAVVRSALMAMSEEQIDSFVSGINSMFNGSEAEDQSGMRLPASNGAGVQAGEEFFAGQGMSGTFAESDPLTSPRATADRRMAGDRRLAQDAIDQRYRNAANFSARFPFVQHVEVWR